MGFNANSRVNCKASQPAWPACVTLLQGAEMVNPERMNTSINKRGLFIEQRVGILQQRESSADLLQKFSFPQSILLKSLSLGDGLVGPTHPQLWHRLANSHRRLLSLIEKVRHIKRIDEECVKDGFIKWTPIY